MEVVAGENEDIKDKSENDGSFVWSWRPRRRRKMADDAFFEEGDQLVGDSIQQVAAPACDSDENEAEGRQETSFCCQIAQCGMTFTSVADYEMHYGSAHRNSCRACRRHFANSHLLELHLLETHNPMFSTLAEKQNMYLCLVETCSEKFSSADHRRRHLVDNHKYPPNFRFTQNKESKKKNRKKKDTVTDAMQVDAMTSDTVTSDTVTSDAMTSGDGTAHARLEAAPPAVEESKPGLVSSSGRRFIYNVPKNICFGQGTPRGFARARGGRNRKHWHQTQENRKSAVSIAEVDMTDLSKALDPT